MQFTGRLIQVLPAQTGQGKNGEWKKQDIILESEGQFPKKVCVSVWGDRMAHLSPTPGELLTIDFDIESREYNGKWYTDIKAWKVTASGSTGTMPPPVSGPSRTNANSDRGGSATPPAESFDDDLPF